MKEKENMKLESLDIHSILHVLCNFPFFGAAQYLGTSFFFTIEPMNAFHLDVSQLQKDTETERLRCTTKTTEHYEYAKRSMCTFDIIRKRTKREYKFIDKFTSNLEGTQIWLYIRNTKGSPGLNDLFNEEDLSWKLEAENIPKTDILSKINGELLNRIWGESNECPITTVLTGYVDVLDQVFGRNGRMKWK